MVCSICKGAASPAHGNAATCPRLKLGADQMAAQIASGAAIGSAVGALTAVCPPAGAAVAVGLMAQSAYGMAQNAIRASGATTQAEKKFAAKTAIVQVFKQV